MNKKEDRDYRPLLRGQMKDTWLLTCLKQCTVMPGQGRHRTSLCTRHKLQTEQAASQFREQSFRVIAMAGLVGADARHGRRGPEAASNVLGTCIAAQSHHPR